MRSARRKWIIKCIYTTFPTPNVGLGRWRLTSATSAELTNHDCARSGQRKWIITSIFATFPTRNVGLVGDNWHRQHPPSLRIMIAREAQGKNYKLYATTRATERFSAWGDDRLGHQKGSHRRGSEATERGRLSEGIYTPSHGWDFLKESCPKVAFWEHF